MVSTLPVTLVLMHLAGMRGQDTGAAVTPSNLRGAGPPSTNGTNETSYETQMNLESSLSENCAGENQQCGDIGLVYPKCCNGMTCAGYQIFGSPGVCSSPTPAPASSCPTECSSPTCVGGDPSNGGQGLSNGKCAYSCSQYYGNVRYCGGGPVYTGNGGIDCAGCGQPSCPTECMSPQCAAGDPQNGGQQLVNGKCIYTCSMPYGTARYCGGGPDYTKNGGVDCSQCA